MKRVFSYFFFFVFLSVLALWLFGYSYILHGLKSTYFRFEKSAQVDDARFFYNDTIRKSNNPFFWPKSTNYNKKNLSKKLRKTLEEYKTHSFIIIHKDSLLYEEYWDKWGVKNNKSNSFSMAKSVVSLVAGIAVDEGFLNSFDQSVKSVFPRLKFFEKNPSVSVGDLLNMASGLDWKEKYFGPFNITAESYFTKNLTDLIMNVDFIEEPGLRYKYQSGSTQLASLMIEKVLVDSIGISFSDFFRDRLWDKIGAEEDALWSLDSNGGVVKSFCCFHSNAKDFAKVGRLFLNSGVVNNKDTLLNSWYFEKIYGSNIVDFYSYGWWKDFSFNAPVYYMRGFLGQFVIVVPDENLIIVRLGRKNLRDNNNPDKPTAPFKIYINEVLKNYI